MHFHIITLFPKGFSSYLGESILKRAIEDKKIRVSFYNPRDFVKNKWKRVDRPPYAGGPGMVIQAEPVVKAITAATIKARGKYKIIFLSPSARVKKIFKMDEISVGPFVLTGGELPAMIIIDCLARQVPGVLGNFDSVEERRVSSSEVYTRPEVFEYTPPGRGKKAKTYRVPKVLLSGNTAAIEKWKQLRKR